MTIHVGDVMGHLTTSLQLYENSSVTFFIAFSGLPVKDRGWLLPIFFASTDKELITFAKERSLWSLSMEE